MTATLSSNFEFIETIEDSLNLVLQNIAFTKKESMYVSDWNAKYAGNNHWEYWDKYSEIFPNQR